MTVDFYRPKAPPSVRMIRPNGDQDHGQDDVAPPGQRLGDERAGGEIAPGGASHADKTRNTAAYTIDALVPTEVNTGT